MAEIRKKLLLHSCCGPCSTAVIERLTDDFDITVFYYNPNIMDRREYELRKSEEQRFISEYSQNTGARIAFIEGDYRPELYYAAVQGLENEPEGGARCSRCFWLRLSETARLAKELGFDCFDTTHTVSPYKNYDTIKAVSEKLSEQTGVEYIAGNYKKKNGYQRSIELSKEYGLYRQHFCGCRFSEDAFAASEKALKKASEDKVCAEDASRSSYGGRCEEEAER